MDNTVFSFVNRITPKNGQNSGESFNVYNSSVLDNQNSDYLTVIYSNVVCLTQDKTAELENYLKGNIIGLIEILPIKHSLFENCDTFYKLTKFNMYTGNLNTVWVDE